MPVDGNRTGFGELPRVNVEDDVLLERVELLHVFFESLSDQVQANLPPALHLTLPGALYASVLRCPSSPWGPFTIAEVRLAARMREKPRSYLLGAVIDGVDEARRHLEDSWGMRLLDGEVHLHRSYDRVEGKVTAEGRVVLQASLMDPEPIPGATLQYGPWANPVVLDGKEQLLLVDPVVSFGEDRQRGHARLPVLDGGWWGAPGVRPTQPIGAFYATADIRLPRPTTSTELIASAGSGLTAVL